MIRRITLISASIFVACVATLAPVFTSIYIADEDAERRDEAELRQFADKAVMRVDLVSNQAFAALSDLDNAPGQSCSPESIKKAARVILNYRYVQDAGAYGDGEYLCSPLLGDVRSEHVVMPPPDKRSKEGDELWFRRKSPLSDAREDIQIGRNGHYVSIDPQSYVDLIDPARRPIATVDVDTGRLIALARGADPDDMLNAWRLKGNVESDAWYYAVAKSSTRSLGVVVKSPRRALIRDWPRLLVVWLIFGVSAGALIGWFAFKRISRQLSFPATLEWAIARKKIAVFYQPIVRLADGECVGVEALVRWTLNDRPVPPEVFVAVAEENGLIQALTDLVLEKTLADLGGLLRARPSFYVSINVSAQDLSGDRFLDVLNAALKGKSIDPSQIRIEATERSLMDADKTRDVIAAFRAAGHPVYIDDFGTGYSSLAYLQTFSVDVLKIDKSFVDTIAKDAASSVVAPHIISMAHELDLEIVAEGVESESQVAYLVQKGVQYGQGWSFAKAMPAGALPAWLNARSIRLQAAAG